jgi:uncharacterized protein (DUF1800 family)
MPLLQTLLAVALWANAAEPKSAPPPAALEGRTWALHVLDRLTFGPRPGDAERLAKEGVEAFIDRQLRPESIDDRRCEAELAPYKTLSMSSWDLSQAFPDKPPLIKRVFRKQRPSRQIIDELASAKLIRASCSERQLQEVLTDFWFNHFNVFAYKGQVKYMVTSYERDVIRPRVLGKFRDLLGAVAHSPAMLVYLDNFQSTIDERYAPAGAREDIEEMESRMGAGRTKLGLNENYARELMELHTLGVDGGYTQDDVVALARILTGWSIERPNAKNDVKDIEYKFKRRLHDPGEKKLLGQDFQWSGEDEGERALDMLAHHPSTAHFIALKLCRRFVSDAPPEELVRKVAARFLDTDGDIRETLRAIFASAEFRDPKAFRAKVKTPFEFVVSAVRATNAELQDPIKLSRVLERMGQPSYLCEPPTGYPDRAEAWVSSGALLARLQAALALFSSKPDAPASADARAFVAHDASGDGRLLLASYVNAFLDGQLSPRTKVALIRRLEDPEIAEARLDDPRKHYRLGRLAALVLGSPDFQRR